MNLTFDYYHNLQETELYLCNPDGRELFPLVGYDRTLTLRFNDLSELKFNCYATTTSSDGTVITIDAYDYIQTRRLVFVTGIGWFVIKNVTEQDNGIVKYKEVSCDSLQATFKDRGFYCEEKVYYFYNPSDPYDSNYDPDKEASVPSVMGQLYQQLGIKQALSQGLSDPATPYSDWTITYINSALTGKGRNFKESTSYGYEWMVKDVEEAFEVVILFDFYYKTIHVMLPSEVTSMSSVIYTFSNFMKDVEIEEDAENIVTVMSCNGDNCDIRAVNPTGTNYICDFGYYMDSAGKWMSSALKTKINQWIGAVNSAQSNYESKVLQLRTAYANLASVNSSAQEVSKIYTDLAAAVARKSVAISENSASTLYGIVWAETVNIGERSADPTSSVYSTDLAASKQITAYKDMPTFDESTRTWSCSGASHTGTLNECYAYVDGNNNQYLYFIDSSNNTSYCKLEGKATINPTTYATEYSCKGFKRYIDLNIANVWTSRHDSKRQALQSSKSSYEATIASLQSQLESISSSLNILNYFSSSPTLLKELMCYWIEGEYTNDNIAVLEDTTQAEAIDLANELRDSGAIELAKVCQPKLQFSLSSVDCTKQYEFRDQMAALELGKIITVEKEEGLWYYPALLEIEYDLDHTDTFSLKFANALRLDDWGYTYGDLISNASSTSRQVAANWQNMMAYSKDREVLSSLIKEPLSSTLRAAFANAVNQEFTIDETGILGRKFANASNNSFVDEQMRIINNVILFTDDNWDTAKTALGKIYYTDSNNNLVTAYGLIGETIIGSLIMSEKMKIVNSDNTISLDSQGITIRKTVNGTTTETFRATPQGDLTIRGNIAGGSININNNFIVDSSGNVQLNGNITWGTGASPTQVLYSATSIAQPSNNTSWSTFPSTGAGWHKTYTSGDIYGTYTYDGGATWTSPFHVVGDDGDSITIEYLYYRSSSSSAPSTPSYSGGTVPSGWSLTPQALTSTYKFVYVSQCTVTNGTYSTWSSPKLWAKYGEDGDTIEIKYLYYKKNSSSAPSTPSYSGGTIPTGWSLTPQAVSSSYPYVFVSQCTVTNGTYGSWSSPTCWAKFGSDASVTDVNVFNALTGNGTMYGCFTSSNNKLYINAAYIQAGTISSNLVLAGEVSASNIVATGGSIGGWDITNSKIYHSYSTTNGTANHDGIGMFCSGGASRASLWQSGVNSPVVFYAGAHNNNPYPDSVGDCYFGVLQDGSVYAQAIKIMGGSIALGSGDNSAQITTAGAQFGLQWSRTKITYSNLNGTWSDWDYSGTTGLNNWYLGHIPDYWGVGMPSCGLRADLDVSDCTDFSIGVSNGGSTFGYAGITFHMNASDNNCYATLSGTWRGSLTASSDRNLKNSIEDLSDKYSAFFDRLNPVRFKLNDGTSGRYHTGFIAQDVETALEQVGLSTNEAALFVRFVTDNPKNNTTEITYGLRYEEFIALNTREIQKLKARVARLEGLLGGSENE